MLNRTEYIGVGGILVVILAYCNNPTRTPILIASVLSIGASTFVARKLINAANKDFGDMIQITGLALAAIPAIAIVKMAIDQVIPTFNVFNGYIATLHKSIDIYNSTAEWIDKIVPIK